MSLTLPEDIEPHLPEGVEWDQPGVYSLYLKKPDNVRDRWEQEFDSTPDFVDMLESKPTTVYVGAASNVMRRLEDHRDGEVRKVALLRVCDIEGLRNVWWFDSTDEAFEQEWPLATLMQQQYENYYVHQR